MNRRAPEQKKDALGHWLCRNCQALVPKGRYSYCSQKCSDDFAIKYFPSHTRSAVFARDKGVCAGCGFDIGKLERAISAALWKFGHGGFTRRDARILLNELKAEWQADHIVECARGGWGLGIENFRTLCIECHKKETARLVRQLASERRPVPESLFAGVPTTATSANAEGDIA